MGVAAAEHENAGLHATVGMAPRIARSIIVTVFGGFCLIALLHVFMLPVGPLTITLSVVAMGTLLLLQLWYYPNQPRTPGRPRRVYLVLGLQACLVYLPLFVFGQAWVGMPGFLAGSVLLVLSPKAAWAAFALIVASMAVAQAQFGGGYVDVAYTTVSTLVTGLIVYGLSRLQGLVRQLHEAQRELAEIAVTHERLRFARDLHDLLGYSLSSITLRTELAHKLVLRQPQRAREELAETLRTSRQALADVRTVAHGYRELSLEQECRSVRSVLAAAEVELGMRADYGDLPVRIATVVATVLREGVTNVLRHSRAENCEITIFEADGEVNVEILNDGLDDALRPPEPRSGSGLHNLSERVRALGGGLTAEPTSEGRYRLAVRLPVRARTDLEPTETPAA
ncbi:hypothetical protein GCM10009799_02640 [Nocardiopsis rhodophaea]|uniref:Signal transduction histidine kinase subgroup 3 dimerisation and phosphoacceptor domain-containing protein n=1 Tax=Nocardiopsis rhodophaea TaxID=280238 RepID=A0ABN2S6L0_9ACTN